MNTDTYTELADELDAESWDWLQTNIPNIADAVQAAVRRGATPDGVRLFVLARCGSHRRELAQRCQSAARYLRKER